MYIKLQHFNQGMYKICIISISPHHTVMHDFIPVFSCHNTEQQCDGVRGSVEVGMSENMKIKNAGKVTSQRSFLMLSATIIPLSLKKQKHCFMWLQQPIHTCKSCQNNFPKQCHIQSKQHINGLVQDCGNSTANALKFLQFCDKPSIWECRYNAYM